MKITVITINYNDKEGLEKTIKSVCSQTFQDFEYLIIDGGSTDGSVETIRKYAERINYWCSEPDKGIYNAMNKGLLRAQGEYVNFMNSGDTFANEQILQEVADALQETHSPDFLYGDHYEYTRERGKSYHKATPFWTFDTPFMHKGFCHQTAFVRTTLAQQHPFDEQLKIAADYKMFYELYTEKRTFHYLPHAIAVFENTGTSQKHHKQAFREDSIIRGVYPSTAYYIHFLKKFYYYPFKSKVLDFIRKR